MTTRKFGRTALIAVLALSIVMSITGGTIAWFTDEVTSENNVIQAGNLDVVLEYKLPDSTDWAEVTSATKLFDDTTLWEPGHTEAVALRIKNAGTLNLKYDLKVRINSETVSTNVYDEEFKLSDSLKLRHTPCAVENDANNAVVASFLGSRDKAQNGTDMDTIQGILGTSFSLADPYLEPNEVHVLALSVYMPTTVGNEANHKTGVNAPQIDLGIQLLATQHTVEEDSFGANYDATATYSNVPPFGMAELDPNTVDLSNWSGSLSGTAELDTVIEFSAKETVDDLAGKPYEKWNADFEVTVSKDVGAADKLILAGNYGTFGWIAFDAFEAYNDLSGTENVAVPANQPVRLLKSFSEAQFSGAAFTYKDVLTFVEVFKCGVQVDETYFGADDIIKVDLMVYETDANGNETGTKNIVTSFVYKINNK